MKKNAMLVVSLSLIVLASVTSALAQEKPATFERELVMTRLAQGQEPAVPVGVSSVT